MTSEQGPRVDAERHRGRVARAARSTSSAKLRRPRGVAAQRTPLRGLFVTATDTGVGKTILSAALLAAMAAAGERVRAHKPVVTGLDDEPAGRDGPPTTSCWRRSAGMTPEEVAPLRYGPAVSPHLAARARG